MAQGALGVGLDGAGHPEGQDIDAAFDELALGQFVRLLVQGQGRSVALKGFPSLARGQPGFLAQSVDAPLLPILGLLLQHFRQRERQEGGQGTAVASRGEAGYRLCCYRGQLDLAASLADAFRNDDGVHFTPPLTPQGFLADSLTGRSR